MRSTELLLPMMPACLLNCRDMTSPIKTWLQSGDFELDLGSSTAAIPVIRNATKTFEPVLAREVDKFLCAMGESFAELQPSRFASRSISWSLIRAYYASYFAAHALLRMTGRCVTKIDNNLSQAAMRALKASGTAPSWQLGSGQYLIQYDENAQTLSFSDKHNAQGGSHQFVWKKFGDLLNELIDSCKLLGSAYQPEILLLQRMAGVLTLQQKYPDHSWLSSVRNDVNYTFAYSVWFPFDGLNTRNSGNLIKMLSCTSSQEIFEKRKAAQTDLEMFCETASFLVSFANAGANALVKRSSTRPFLSRSYTKLQRLLGWPQ